MPRLLKVEARRKVGSQYENRHYRKVLALPALPVPGCTLGAGRREYKVETVYMTDGEAAVVARLVPDYEAYKREGLADRCRLMEADGFRRFDPAKAGRGRPLDAANDAEET